MALCARPAAADSSSSSPGERHQFTNSASTDGQTMRKVCTGFFKVDYEPAAHPPAAYGLEASARHVQARLLEAKAICRHRENPGSFYMELARIGLEFGPAFRNMSGIWRGNLQSYCVVDVVNPSSERNVEIGRAHV